MPRAVPWWPQYNALWVTNEPRYTEDEQFVTYTGWIAETRTAHSKGAVLTVYLPFTPHEASLEEVWVDADLHFNWMLHQLDNAKEK